MQGYEQAEIFRKGDCLGAQYTNAKAHYTVDLSLRKVPLLTRRSKRLTRGSLVQKRRVFQTTAGPGCMAETAPVRTHLEYSNKKIVDLKKKVKTSTLI